MAKRTTQYIDYSGKKIDRIEISISRIKSEDIPSIPQGMPIIEIRHQNSRMCDELQLVDLVSGAIFCCFEHSEEEYLKSLKDAGASVREIRSKIGY